MKRNEGDVEVGSMMEQEKGRVRGVRSLNKWSLEMRLSRAGVICCKGGCRDENVGWSRLRRAEREVGSRSDGKRTLWS